MCIVDRAALQAVVDNITFGPSGAGLDGMDLGWQIEEFARHDLIEPERWVLGGWHIRFNFLRPDATTGRLGRGTGRWEVIERDASETSVVKTCWVLLELLVKHELMEAFTYKGVRLFDPHRSVEELAR